MDNNKKNEIVKQSIKISDPFKEKENNIVASHRDHDLSHQQKPKNSRQNDRTFDLLLEMKNKISNTNSGLEIMKNKFENIDNEYKHLYNEVAELKDSVYNHDTGIYARLKNIESEKSLELHELKSKLNNIDSVVQKNVLHNEELSNNLNQIRNEINKNFQSIELKLSELTTWKNNVDSILKWLILTCASGAAGLIGKLFYDILKIL